MYEYGLQLYSVRDITDKDLLGAIEQVSKMGYTGMEFAGFFGHDAKAVKDCMDRCGAKAWGTHTGVDQLTDEKLMDTIAYHKAIDCSLCIIPWAPHQNLADLEKLAALIEKVQPVMKEHGITLEPEAVLTRGDAAQVIYQVSLLKASAPGMKALQTAQ